jgi:methionyl-tRNA formyltransferase
LSGRLRIIFLGTPEFAVGSLDILFKSGYEISAVVTSPDAPSGRGLKLRPSPVKRYALQHQIPVLQPEKLKNAKFLEELKGFQANLQVVVAFRMLPEVVWAMPELGTFNLHASMLPEYRGAAPINWAIINGETETGVTTFYLKHEIDTGDILFQEKTYIGPEETAGELHDRLMVMGANLVLKTVRAIEHGMVRQMEQDQLIKPGTDLKPAPKIFRQDCQIDWEQPVARVFNFIRGLSPYPGAYTFLKAPDGQITQVKVFLAKTGPPAKTATPGSISTDGKRKLKIACADGWIEILEIQQAGKRRMATYEFLLGFPVTPLFMAFSEH